MTRTRALILVIVLIVIGEGGLTYGVFHYGSGLDHTVAQQKIDEANNLKNAKHDSAAGNARAQRAAEMGSCHRGNILQLALNRSNLNSYRYQTQQIRVQAGSMNANYRALAAAGVPRRALNRARRQSEQALVSERQQAASLQWIPLTDCKKAINTPGFTAPLPVPFTKQSPPSTALKLGPLN